MSKENKQSFILIYSNDTFDVYYDKDTKRYHIDVFDDGHYWDEVWFDEYKEEENADSDYRTISSYMKQGKLPPLNSVSDKGIHIHKHGWT